MIKVEAIIDNAPYIITAFCGNITLNDDIKSLGRQLHFDYLNNKVLDHNTVWIDIDLGNTIMLYDDDELIFQGTIQKATRNGLSKYQYEAYDNAIYLNRKESRIQFNNMAIKDALEKLCEQEYIPCEVACEIDTKVTKIYNGDTISKIIEDLLKLAQDDTGYLYRREYNNGKLYINTFDNLKMIWESEPLVSAFSQEFSCDALANEVVILSGNEKNTQVVATTKDEESIKKYGLYTKYVKLDGKNTSQANDIAEKTLKVLSHPSRKTSCTLLGDNYVRSGRILKFNQPNIGMIGEYLVSDCSHSYNAGKHTMDVTLILKGEVNDNVGV